jgi:3'-5' exoribonuclease
VEAMFRELEDLCLSISDRHLRKLMGLFFEDEGFVSAFRRAPAAKGMHHVYIGGLLEHTLSMVKLARLIAGHYTCLDGDILVAGALLHDVGKIQELEYASGFDYTDEGRLVGHLIQGMRILDEKLALLPDFPRETAMHMRHIMASHHGQAEFGSPRPPQTPEAVAMHHLDNLDAKVWTYISTIASEADQPGDFTSFHRALEVYIYKGDADRRPEKTYGFHIEEPAQESASAKTKILPEEPPKSGDSLDLFNTKKR